MKCPKCGTQVPDGAQFCPECGTKMPQPTAGSVCPHCGKPIHASAVFCPECGKRVAESTPNANRKAAPKTSTAAPKPAASSAGSAKRPAEQKQKAEKPKKSRGGLKVLAVILVLVLAFTAFVKPGFLRKKETPNTNWPVSGESTGNNSGGSSSGSSASSGSSGKSSSTLLFQGAGIEPTVLKDGADGGVIIGQIKENGCILYVENGSFPENSTISATPVSQDQLKTMGALKNADRISVPVEVTCDGYDGSFFASDVVLTLKMPKMKDETEYSLQNYAFAYYDEDSGEIRCLWPDSFDLEKGTMSVALPHLTPFWGTQLTQEETVEQYLDKYSMDLALKQRNEQQALAELGPYVEAKVNALGLTQEAAKDLLYAVLGSMTSSSHWNFKGEGSEFAKQTAAASASYGLGVMRDVLDNGEAHAAVDGMKGYVNSQIMYAWDKLGYTKNINKICKSEYLGGAVEQVAGNAGSIVTMVGNFSAGTDEGFRDGMKELGSLLENSDTTVSISTKAVKLVASTVQLGFIEWKSNKVEEIYQIYKNGGKSVIAGDRETFLEWLHYGSGDLGQQKGIYRFFSMDKSAELADKYGWGKVPYDQLPPEKRDEFARRAENALLEYFENRRQQEALAAQIKEQQRPNIETMLQEGGALDPYKYDSFFGEGPGQYDMTARLEKLAELQQMLSKFVDEDALYGTAGKDAKVNFGTIMNWYLEYSEIYPNGDDALDYLKDNLAAIGLLKKELIPEKPSAPKPEETKPEEPKEPTEPKETLWKYTGKDYVWALKSIDVYGYRAAQSENSTLNKVTVSAGALFIHISEYENSYWSDVGYDIETPGLILDPEIVEYLSFVATSDREYEYGYGLNDYSFYEMYLGDELWRRYIHDPNSDDPEDLIQYGQHIQHQWDGQKCVYYPGAYLPEATRGGTFQILLHASNWNHVSVVLTYEALPASTPESDIQFELNPVYFESFRNYTVVD